jgi:alpha-L-rhamnosidase
MKTIGILVAGLSVIFLSMTGLADGASLIPTQLRCEYRINPLGIDTLRPRLSWRLESEHRDEKQTAYQVVVASSKENLESGRFDLWDSDRVMSDKSTQVEYSGKPLVSRMKSYWQVRVWDKAGRPSTWSPPAVWSMGLLNLGDWQGRWIAATEKPFTTGMTRLAGYHALEARSPDEIKWVQVDLGAEHVIDSVNLCPPAPSGFEQVKGFGFPVRFRLDASNDPDFGQSRTIVDHTQEDYPNPGNELRAFGASGIRARYVRVTATRLWNRGSGAEPFCFALAEMEILSKGTNVALGTSARAKDSVEASGWSLKKLTDGERLPATNVTASGQPGNAAVLMRKEIKLDGKVVHATAFLCGLGYSELEINGRKIGTDVLDPGFTDFSRRVLYRTYDVTDVIRPGANALGVVLGGGWFNLATPDLFAFERAPWSASPRLLFQLHIELADGTTRTVGSDDSWKWSTGAITFNCVRGGETIDAREDKPGWSLAGYDDADWHTAVAVARPTGKLVSQQHPPIRVTESIRPVRLTEPKPGVYIFDLGVNIAGWAQLSTRGPRGTKITLQFNERLKPDGTLDTGNLTSHTYGRFQTEEFILKGEGGETFEPRFTYHGFRYVQVTGLAERPTLYNLIGRWVTTDPEPAGQFACSNEKINQVQKMIVRTLLNNMHGIPTDCPQREKMGWMNDGCVCMETAFFNLDTPLFYRKWFNDMVDGQDANGHVPDFVPTSGWGRSRADGSPGEMADPWWGGAIVLTPWKLYQYYGDIRILQEGYSAMKAYVDYLTSYSHDHEINWGLGDWLDESAGGGGRRVPVIQTSTAAYAYFARIVSQTALVLNQTADAEKYAALADTIRTGFNKNYMAADSGLYAKDSQTAQALPLALGLVPEDKSLLVLRQLVDNIRGPRRNHVSTGIVGTLYLFHALMEKGRDDLNYLMMTQEDYPGWLNMINQGATSTWEAWNGEASQNHPTLGCVGFWFYQGLAGIRPDFSAPGFKKIMIRPAVVGDLTWVRGRYDSIHGPILSEWKREGGQLTLNLTIPANTTATVFVPAKDAASVTESGKAAGQAEGVQFVRMDDSAAVYAVGSGTYRFQSVWQTSNGK